MDQLVQCPVCTLYLHAGMSLELHLDTHPKDQVIRALCSVASTPAKSPAPPPYAARCAPCACRPDARYRAYSRTPEPCGKSSKCSLRASPHDRNKERGYRRGSRTPTAFDAPSPVDRLFTRDSAYDQSHSTSRPLSIDLKSSDSRERYQYSSDESGRSVSDITVTESPGLGNRYLLVPRESTPHDDGMATVSRLSTTTTDPADPEVSLVERAAPSTRTLSDLRIDRTSIGVTVLKSGMAPLRYVAPDVNSVFMLPPTRTYAPRQPSPGSRFVIAKPSPVHPGRREVHSPYTSRVVQPPSGGFAPSASVLGHGSRYQYGESVSDSSFVPSLSSGGDEVDNAVTGAATPFTPFTKVVVLGGSASAYPQRVMAPLAPTDSFADSNVNYVHPDEVRVTVENENRPKDLPEKPLVLEVTPIISITPQVSNRSNLKWSMDRQERDRGGLESGSVTSESGEGRSTTGLKILSNIKVEVPLPTQAKQGTYDGDAGAAQVLMKKEHAIKEESADCFQNNLESAVRARPDGETVELLDERPAEGHESNVDAVTIANTFSVIKNMHSAASNSRSSPAPMSEDADGTRSSDLDNSVPDLTCKEKPSISPCSELSNDSSIRLPFPSQSVKEDMGDSVTGKNKRPVKISLPVSNLFITNRKKILHIKNAKVGLRPVSKGKSSTCISLEKETTLRDSGTDVRPVSEEESASVNSRVFATVIKIDEDADDHSLEDVSELQQIKPDISDDEESSCVNDEERKDFIQLQNMPPVSVASYASVDGESGDVAAEVYASEDVLGERQTLVNMISENYFGDNIYADYFTNEKGEIVPIKQNEPQESNSFDLDIRKREICIVEEEQPCDAEYIWDSNSHKSNFALSNFMHQGSGELEQFGGSESAGGDDRDYTEMEALADSYDADQKNMVMSEEQSNGDNEQSLNICADEKMPPRGELSGQESNGDMDTPWMYQHDINGSTSYDLLARETWTSDASDIEMPTKNEDFNILNIPQNMDVGLLESRQYKCSTCGMAFNCPKERRVHRSKEHPAPSTADPSKPKRVRTRKKVITSTTTNISIKQEARMPDGDSLLTIARTKLNILQASSTLHVQRLEDVKSDIKDVLDLAVDSKASLETLIKVEGPKRKRRDYLCTVCKQDLGSEVAFNAHLKIHPLECLTCGKNFYRRANLQMHTRMHLGIKNFKCEVCEKRFTTRQKLREHHNIHSGLSPIKCNLCPETFRRHSNMVQHRNAHHYRVKRKQRDLVCSCGEVFHTRRKMLWHRETHEERPRACPYCSDKYVHTASLTRHIRRAHNAYYTPGDTRLSDNLRCPVCDRVYLKDNLEAHLRTHTGDKPFLCVVCNKGFTTKWNLKLHRWTHAARSAKPFKCAQCKSAFLRRADYMAHLNSHRAVKPYTCNYCGCKFIRKYNCQRHVKEHESAKKHACQVPDCGKSFHRSYYLTEHMRVHSGVRPFSCNICGKTSSNKSNHNKHLKIHHAREPVPTEG